MKLEERRRINAKRNKNWLPRWLMNTYGLTLADYNRMYSIQGGVCAICGESETAKNKFGETKQLAVDHDTKSGRVRGLLCQRCNHALGSLKDDRNLLESAIDYLCEPAVIRLAQ